MSRRGPRTPEELNYMTNRAILAADWLSTKRLYNGRRPKIMPGDSRYPATFRSCHTPWTRVRWKRRPNPPVLSRRTLHICLRTIHFRAFALLHDCISPACCKKPFRNKKGSSLRDSSTLCSSSTSIRFLRGWRRYAFGALIVARAVLIFSFHSLLFTC